MVWFPAVSTLLECSLEPDMLPGSLPLELVGVGMTGEVTVLCVECCSLPVGPLDMTSSTPGSTDRPEALGDPTEAVV